MFKNFALLSLLAFAEAVQLDCGPCNCDCDEPDPKPEPDPLPIGGSLYGYIYANDDCTGDVLELRIDPNRNEIEAHDSNRLD